MTVRVTSRYASGTYSLIALTQEGDLRPILTKDPVIPTIGTYVDYVIVYGDRLDALANKYYGDPIYWWKLAQVNPTLDELAPLTPGVTIRVPSA